jgi:hypothetical protein
MAAIGALSPGDGKAIADRATMELEKCSEFSEEGQAGNQWH